jgi:hypothetical protein
MNDHQADNGEASPLDGDQKDLHLRSEPAPFEKISTPARVSEVEQAVVTHYAYDPQTYEILCRPGQRLNSRKARRLQDLGLYAHVVKLTG